MINGSFRVENNTTYMMHKQKTLCSMQKYDNYKNTVILAQIVIKIKNVTLQSKRQEYHFDQIGVNRNSCDVCDDVF